MITFRFHSNPFIQTSDGLAPTLCSPRTKQETGTNPTQQPNKTKVGAIPKMRVGATPTHATPNQTHGNVPQLSCMPCGSPCALAETAAVVRQLYAVAVYGSQAFKLSSYMLACSLSSFYEFKIFQKKCYFTYLESVCAYKNQLPPNMHNK